MAVQAVHATRETVVGAFDVFMTQTAQRTNNDLRVLTTVSLTLPPATVVASTLGMNIMPKYMLHSWVYWAALALMLVIGAVVLVTMRAPARCPSSSATAGRTSRDTLPVRAVLAPRHGATWIP
jgi:Mg2+ and Co2+ transporters